MSIPTRIRPSLILLISSLSTPPVCLAEASTTLTLSDDAEPTLRVEAHWEPIVEGRYDLHRRFPDAFNYAPAEAVREYSSADFRVFLPSTAVGVGDIWQLEASHLQPMLRQFHTGATTHLRRGNPGAFACLSALSEGYAEITFRVHGELELVAEKVYLTLSQFTGHVLIDRKEQRVVSFSLEVPDRNTNADINAYGFADIVYIPRMDLGGGDASLRDTIEWSEAISESEATERLAGSFYRFKDIDWTELEDAIARAQSEDKPIHVLLLFGNLDDESC